MKSQSTTAQMFEAVEKKSEDDIDEDTMPGPLMFFIKGKPNNEQRCNTPPLWPPKPIRPQLVTPEQV
ncbi:MAG: hypothetical protein ACFFCH_04960 [Promethearchaeota archaeon]